MSSQPDNDEGILLNLFCARQGDAWRLYLRPTALPPWFRGSFDKQGEAYPVHLDLDDLDRYMAKRSLAFDKRVSKLGDVELTARGRAAAELMTWLSTAFASGMRGEAVENDKTGGRRS
jgi:hypothetical protein